MVRSEGYSQPPPRIAWRTLAGLFDEAWRHERRRRRNWLAAIVILLAGGALTASLTGPGARKPIGRTANVVAARKSGSIGARQQGLPTTTRVVFVSRAPKKAIPVGVPLTVKIQLVDRFNKPVLRAGVPVYLNQIIWGTEGPVHAYAVVNGKPVGNRVAAPTNAQGIATFAVTGTEVSMLPTSFDAFLQAKFAYGVSGELNVTFSPASKHLP